MSNNTQQVWTVVSGMDGNTVPWQGLFSSMAEAVLAIAEQEHEAWEGDPDAPILCEPELEEIDENGLECQWYLQSSRGEDNAYASVDTRYWLTRHK